MNVGVGLRSASGTDLLRVPHPGHSHARLVVRRYGMYTDGTARFYPLGAGMTRVEPMRETGARLGQMQANERGRGYGHG